MRKNDWLWVAFGAFAFYLYKKKQDNDTLANLQSTNQPMLSNHWLPYPSIISPAGAAAIRATNFNARAGSFTDMANVDVPNTFLAPDSFSLTLQQIRNS